MILTNLSYASLLLTRHEIGLQVIHNHEIPHSKSPLN